LSYLKRNIPLKQKKSSADISTNFDAQKFVTECIQSNLAMLAKETPDPFLT